MPPNICINKPIKTLKPLIIMESVKSFHFTTSDIVALDKKQYVTAPYRVEESKTIKKVVRKIIKKRVCLFFQNLLSIISFKVVDDMTSVTTKRSEIYLSVLLIPNSKRSFKNVYIPIGRAEKNTE